MNSFIEWLKEIVAFLKDNWQFVCDNKYIFFVWSIMCVSIVVSIYELIRKKDKEEIKRLKEEKSNLEATNNLLRKALKEFDFNSWIRVSQTPATNQVAEDISNSLKKKKRSCFAKKASK